jgi:endonuclease YncB( thermonuclease family)
MSLRSALKNLIENKILKILKYQPKTDMFDGNLVEIVIASGDFAEDNTNASKFMIENGFAKLKPTDNDYIFDELTYLEQNAKLGKIGLWGKCR